MVRKLGNVHKVVYKSRHYRAGLVFVKERKWKLLQMREHILAHIALHTHAHDVTPIGNEVVECHLRKIEQKYNSCPGEHQTEITVRNVVVDDVFRDKGIEEVCQRDKKRAEHIEHKQLFVRLIVFNKFAYHCALHLF